MQQKIPQKHLIVGRAVFSETEHSLASDTLVMARNGQKAALQCI